jgi:tRNA threonylcarbamoyladenosine biosynthesis protein TsaE
MSTAMIWETASTSAEQTEQLAEALGSPTFTLSREYETPKFTIAHFDFYRLGEAGIVGDELAEVIGDPEYVTVVEWGDIVHDVLPEDRLTVRIKLNADESRTLSFEYPEKLTYLLEGIK